MYVRANEALFCIGPKGKKAGAPAKTPKEQEKKKDDEFHE